MDMKNNKEDLSAKAIFGFSVIMAVIMVTWILLMSYILSK
jgi:hypothetical protein